MRVALNEGATPREILEAMQAVIAPMGALAFRRGRASLGGGDGVRVLTHRRRAFRTEAAMLIKSLHLKNILSFKDTKAGPPAVERSHWRQRVGQVQLD